MAFELPALRIALYFALILFSVILLALCAARINFTAANIALGFYEPVMAELIVTALLSMGWAGFMIFAIHRRLEHRVSTFLFELVGLFILWLFWISGAAVASSMFPNLNTCQNIDECRVLSALLAFAWLGWIVVTALFIISLMFSISNRAYNQPLHGRDKPQLNSVVNHA